MKANIAKIVQEVLAQQAAEKAACENDTMMRMILSFSA